MASYEYDRARAEFIKQAERIIADHCSTKNYKEAYRYPVKYVKNGIKYKTKGPGCANVSMEEIPTMYYEFGVHRVDIGMALIEILEFFEQHMADDEVLRGNFDFYEDPE